MGAKGQRKCCNCKEFFIPDARNATRQRYCSKPECRAASKKAAQQQWCNKNPSYFRGPINVSGSGGARIPVTGRKTWIQVSCNILMRYKTP